MGKLGDLKRTLFLLRGTRCEVCGKREAVQCAHVFIGTDNRKKKNFDKFLTVEENCCLSCLVCHGKDLVNDPDYKRVDTHAFRCDFFETQIIRYGPKRLADWITSIPSKKKRGSEFRELYILAKRNGLF